MVTKKTENLSSETSPCKSSWNLTSILLICILVLQVASMYLLTGNSLSLPEKSGIDVLWVKRAILEVEYDKVWWKENYEIMQKAQKLSVTDPQNPSNVANMKKYVESFGTGANTVSDNSNSVSPEANQEFQIISSGTLQKVLSTAVFEGNKDATIAVIEYSDMECPFCIRQYHDTELSKKLLSEFSKDVKFAFKNNRGVNHQGTEAKAIGLLCAEKTGWESAYIKFYHTIMDGSTMSSVYPVSDLSKIVTSIWIDLQKWKKCFDTKDTLSAFDSETAEAQSFGLGGTPGTLIINLKTLKYTTVEGAYPYEIFTAKIKSLLK